MFSDLTRKKNTPGNSEAGLSEMDRKTSHTRFFNCQKSNFSCFKQGTNINNCERKKFAINL